MEANGIDHSLRAIPFSYCRYTLVVLTQHKHSSHCQQRQIITHISVECLIQWVLSPKLMKTWGKQEKEEKQPDLGGTGSNMC